MRKLTIISVLFLLLINVIALTGIAYNRSGKPLTSIELTERELPVRYSYSKSNENSGLSLVLAWQTLGSYGDRAYQFTHYDSPSWLNNKKLTALGFDMEKINRTTKRDSSSVYNKTRVATLVLEYQGESYRKALEQAAARVAALKKKVAKDPADVKLSNRLRLQEKELARDKISESRLFVIDAGLDTQALMKKYPDQSKYLFMQGKIGLSWDQGIIVGRIRGLLIGDVHVPLPLSNQLSSLSAGDRYDRYGKKPVPPRYQVQLKIGKRFEPWLTSVTPLKQ
jgi:hypothetical protein